MRAAAVAVLLLALALGASLRVPPALGAGHSLVTLDLDSGATRTLARARLGWEAPQPTPDGRSLLAIREDSSGPGRRTTRVRRRIDLLSGRQTRLPGIHEGGGSFSPDGTRVFVQTGPTDVGEMVLRTLAGRPLVRLRPRSRGERIIPTPDAIADGPSWSPDGTRVAYALVPPELFCLACFFSPDGPPSSLRTESGLAVADATTGAVRVIVPPGTRDVRDAVWTRDGRGLIADIEDVRRAGRPAAPRRDPDAGRRSPAGAAGAARRAARS